MKKLSDTIIRLKWAADHFGNIGMMTGFGYSGVALMHIINDLHIPVSVYFIDTGFHFHETYIFAKKFRDVIWLSLRKDIRNLLLKENSEPWRDNSNLCCHYFKITPLLEVLPKHKLWIDALRKEQTEYRKNLSHIEIDGRGILKLHPLLLWKSAEVWKYIRDTKLITNPLHEKGYPSIGCKYCTFPVSDTDDERSGRWKDSLKKECGLHESFNIRD